MNDSNDHRLQAWLATQARHDAEGDLAARVVAALPARTRGWSPWALGAAGLLLAARAAAALVLFFAR